MSNSGKKAYSYQRRARRNEDSADQDLLPKLREHHVPSNEHQDPAVHDPPSPSCSSRSQRPCFRRFELLGERSRFAPPQSFCEITKGPENGIEFAEIGLAKCRCQRRIHRNSAFLADASDVPATHSDQRPSTVRRIDLGGNHATDRGGEQLTPRHSSEARQSWPSPR